MSQFTILEGDCMIGLLVDEAADPLALIVNPQPFSLEMCAGCEKIYDHREYRKLPRLCLYCMSSPGEQCPRCHHRTEHHSGTGCLVAATTSSACACPVTRKQIELCKCCSAPDIRRLCGCGSSTWVSHFATFPELLVEPCLAAGTSAHGACPHCGNPYERIVEWAYVGDWNPDPARGHDQTSPARTGNMGKHDRGAVNGIDKSAFEKRKERDGAHAENRFESKELPEGSQFSQNRILANTSAGRDATGEHENPFPAPLTLGWRATCSHPLFPAEPVPCVVLDPFSGSGRTGLVALKLGLDYIGIERNSNMPPWRDSKRRGCRPYEPFRLSDTSYGRSSCRAGRP